MPTWLRRIDYNRPAKCSIFTTLLPVSPMTICAKYLMRIKCRHLPRSDYSRTRVRFYYFILKVKKKIILIFFFYHWIGEKSSSGHLEFNTLQEAVEALVICNHIPLSGASTFFTRPNLFIFLSINFNRLNLNRCQMAVHDQVVLLDTATRPEWTGPVTDQNKLLKTDPISLSFLA